MVNKLLRLLIGVVGPRGNQTMSVNQQIRPIIATWTLFNSPDSLNNGNATELRKDRRREDLIMTLRKTNRKMGNMTKVSHLSDSQ